MPKEARKAESRGKAKKRKSKKKKQQMKMDRKIWNTLYFICIEKFENVGCLIMGNRNIKCKYSCIAPA